MSEAEVKIGRRHLQLARSALAKVDKAPPGEGSLKALEGVADNLRGFLALASVVTTIRNEILQPKDVAGAEKMLGKLKEDLPNLVKILENELKQLERKQNKKWWQFWI